jgi:hypothetical protein
MIGDTYSMIKFAKKQLLLPLFLLFLGFFFVAKSHAASLSTTSDTISTSRPSAAAPLAADQSANATQVTVVDLPTSRFNSALWLASDSAVLLIDTGQSLSTATVASMSTANTPASNQRRVFFTGQVSNTHHKGTTMITPITATHIIRFTTNSAIPSGGHIVITFPGSGSNIASPSASTFSFNNLSSSSILCNPTNACSGTKTISAPKITLTTGTAISGGTAIVIAIGCTGIVSSAGICSTAAPTLINPTKSAASGTANTWKIAIKIQDNNSIDLDSSSVKVGTIESVEIQVAVEASLTFTITGLANKTNVTTQNASCIGGDVTNPGSGLDATSTFVNLGKLANGAINISAQELTVSTNGASGYAITATSSGRFINPASGVWITDANGGNGLTANDTPASAVLPVSGSPAFGIHPCGADVTTATWANAATGFNSGAKYSNPWNTGVNGYNASIASFGAPANARKTEIEYAATIADTTPAGIYSTVFTYVATPIF